MKRLIVNTLKDLGAMDPANMFTKIRGKLDATSTPDNVRDEMSLLHYEGFLEVIGVERNYRDPLFVVYDINR